MPDISKLGSKIQTPSSPQEDLSATDSDTPDLDSTEIQSTEPLVVPESCLACQKEKVTHLTVPCRHPCFCLRCAMKMATGGRCKVLPPADM